MRMRVLLLIAALGSTLAACGFMNDGDGAEVATSNVTIGTAPSKSLAAGYTFSGDTAGSYAEAFMAADGTGFMLVSSGDDQAATALYVFGSGGVVNRKPAAITGSVSADTATAAPLTVTALTLASAAGSYSAMVDGQEAAFTIGADGSVTAGSTTCKVSGSVAANGALGTLTGTLNTSGCSAANATYTCYLIRSTDYAPASLRIVGYSSSAVLDTFAN